MSEYRIHPIFGILTDSEEIAVFDRQQRDQQREKEYLEAYLEAEYRAQEEAYYKAMEEEMYNLQWGEYWMGLLQENEMITD